MSYSLKWTAAFVPSMDTVGWRPQEYLLNASNISSSDAGPALANAFGKVYCVHNTANAAATSVLKSATFDQDNGWQGEGNIPQNYTVYRQALSAINDGAALYCAYAGGSSDHLAWYLSTTSGDISGNPWSSAQNLANGWRVAGGPALVTFNSSLWYMFSGTDSMLYCNVGAINGNSVEWGDAYHLYQLGGNSTSAGPAAAAFDTNDSSSNVWCVFKSRVNAQLYVTTSVDGINWADSNSSPPIPGGLTDAAPALVYLPQEKIMLCVFGSNGDSTLWYTYSQGDPSQWTTPQQINGISRAPGTDVGLAVYNDIVFCAFCGTS